jgi:hypothetical protein
MPDQIFAPVWRALDRNGEPQAGAKLYTYISGTMSSLVMTDEAGTALAWPVLADANGVFPQIFYGGVSTVKAIVTDADDVVLPGYPVDPCLRVPEVPTGAAITIPLGETYLSAAQTITSAGQLVLAHGLGAIPELISYRLTCVTAEAGYVAGNVIPVDFTATSATTDAINTAKIDATNITIRFSDATNCFAVGHATTGVLTALTNANWQLLVRAWA